MKISAHPLTRSLALLRPLVVWAMVSILSGQVAPEPAAPRVPAPDGAVRLSPFVISSEQETGW
jgi:hypothetical protein